MSPLSKADRQERSTVSRQEARRKQGLEQGAKGTPALKAEDPGLVSRTGRLAFDGESGILPPILIYILYDARVEMAAVAKPEGRRCPHPRYHEDEDFKARASRTANLSQRSKCGHIGSPRLASFMWDLLRLTGRAKASPEGSKLIFSILYKTKE